MSGSGNSSIGFGGENGGGEDPCQSLRLDRLLDAPVHGVAETLRVGDVLALELQEGPPPVVALNAPSGSLAGSVVPTVRLLECLRQGVPFEARVTATNGGGAVRVEVRFAA